MTNPPGSQEPHEAGAHPPPGHPGGQPTAPPPGAAAPGGPPPSGSGGRSGPPAWVWIVAIVVVLVLVAGAVVLLTGGDDTAEPPATTEAPEESGLVTSIDDLGDAVAEVHVEAAFVDPEIGEVSGDFAGTAFIVDPAGFAVTNNHVVAGASTVEVLVGDEDEPRDARIVATSECSDLAVIDIEGDDFPYLRWYEDDPEPGLEVVAAGFPTSDRESQYTLTKGIVSKEPAEVATYHASVDSVIEHDAKLDGGNSGGPLVTDPGAEVVGINYFVDIPENTVSGEGQFLAISAQEASEIVDVLLEGDDVDSIGVNGQAVFDESTGDSGVWVAGVEAGSAAADVGLEPGDVITRMDGSPVGQDGTMEDFCSVLRTQGQDDEIGIQVLRFETDELLEGTLNDPDDPLEAVEALGTNLADDVTGLDGGGAAYDQYVSIVDDQGRIGMEVPAVWSDVDGSPLDLGDGTSVPSLWAAPDIQGFLNTWDVPGVRIELLEGAPDDDAATVTQLLSEQGADGCTDPATQEAYEDSLYVGVAEYRTGCGTAGAAAVGFVGGPADGSFTFLLYVQLVSQADFEALDRIFASFVAL